MVKINLKLMLIIFVGTLIFSNLVLAQFMPPNAFYGSVTWNGKSAPDGTTVTAKINGVEVASTTTKDGKYGYEPIFYIDDPHSDRTGSIIKFFVNGVDTGQTSIFANGKITLLDLSATGGGTSPPPSGPGSGPGGLPPTETEEEEPEEETTEQPCEERWVCEDWSECEDGKQNRTCEDVNNCGTERDIPLMVQPCTTVEEGEEEAPEKPPSVAGPTGLFLGLSTTDWVLGIIIGVIVAVVIIFLLTRRKR